MQNNAQIYDNHLTQYQNKQNPSKDKYVNHVLCNKGLLPHVPCTEMGTDSHAAIRQRHALQTIHKT